MIAVREDLTEVVAGGMWIFLGSLVVSLSGFIFWVILSRLAGVESVGIASAVVSASGVATTLVSAGLNIAVVRVVAAGGPKAFTTSVILAVVLGSAAAVLTIPLIHSLGYGGLTYFASALALLTAAGVAVTQSLIGFELFKGFFTTLLTGSLAKVAVGVALAVAGLGALAPLIGYLAYPVVALITGTSVVLPLLMRSGTLRLDAQEFKELIKLTFSNYPYTFSTQLMTMLGVYFFAYLIREAVPVGTLYIALMITLAISAIPNSLLSAALPIGVRRGTEPFAEGFRIGLSLATPIVVFVGAASSTVLRIINPELLLGANTLKILLLSLPPLTALTSAIMSLNRRGDIKGLAAVGLIRLAVLTALLPPLTHYAGLLGASLAYLAANTTPLPIALKNIDIGHNLLKLWGIQATLILTSASLSNYVGELPAAAFLTIATIPLMHATRTYSIQELTRTLRTAIVHLLRS